MKKQKLFKESFVTNVVYLYKKRYTKFTIKKSVHRWFRLLVSLVIKDYLQKASESIMSNITSFIGMTEGSHRTYTFTIKKNILYRYKNEIDPNYQLNDYIFPGRHNSYRNQIIPIPKNKKLNWRLLHDIRDRVQDIVDSNSHYLLQRRYSLMLSQICRQQSKGDLLCSFISPYLLKVSFFKEKILSLLSMYHSVNYIICNCKRLPLSPMLPGFNPILIMIGKLISLGCLDTQILDLKKNLKRDVQSISIKNVSHTPRLIMETEKGPIILTRYDDEYDPDELDDNSIKDPKFVQFFEEIYDFQFHECQLNSDNQIDIQGLERIIKGEVFTDYGNVWYHEPIIYYWYQELCVRNRNIF